jgi:hypothetical protein
MRISFLEIRIKKNELNGEVLERIAKREEVNELNGEEETELNGRK